MFSVQWNKCIHATSRISFPFFPQNKDAVTFALKMNKTEFRGRRIRVFPSSENPHVETGMLCDLICKMSRLVIVKHGV